MNKKSLVIISAVTLLASNAWAAKLMERADFDKVSLQYEKVGTISTENEMAPMDARRELSKLADEKGGDVYVITSDQSKKKIHATADVYKKK
ncbi:DUF1471 family periplasmic protein YahO [Kosakonia oryziphila]|uniref:YdgH/BhsA/McbA-like domain-containing protein n=1 Tax=Kosakonia oryziphila TaxID=1005667 RepID=A0A1C4CQC7_9ENTR|nr:DUF1471 family periplasmic protein YahO [Kosakonia oryziphila]SCC21253.1 Protein of unknown function [Kosakonia oryziphila]